MSETQNTEVKPTVESPDTPEYRERMVALAEGRDPGTTEGGSDDKGGTEGEGEKLLAGKYKSVEDLEKGYQELQKAFSGRKTEKSEEGGSEEKPEGETPETPKTTDLERPKEPEVPKGIDFDRYTKSFMENDGLTDEDYKSLEKDHGIGREAADVYVAGLKAMNAERVNAAVKAVGGEERFEQVRGWASQNLSDAEFEAFQSQLQSARTAADVAVVYETLNTRYTKATGEANLVTGNPASGPNVAGFANKTEMAEAVNDPRYTTDPSYQKQVQQKIANSSFL